MEQFGKLLGDAFLGKGKKTTHSFIQQIFTGHLSDRGKFTRAMKFDICAKSRDLNLNSELGIPS